MKNSATLPKLLKLVRYQNPNLSDGEIDVLEDGWDHVIVVARNSIAYRFPRTKEQETKILVEANFLKTFSKESPLKAPQLKIAHNDPLDLTYATYKFIPGEKLSPEVFSKLSPPIKARIAFDLSGFLVNLHRFPVRRALALGLKQNNPKLYWQNRLTKIKMQTFPKIKEAERSWVLKLFSNFLRLLETQPPKPVVCHNDLAPEHILYDPKNQKLSGIIDFGDLSLGDSAYDFQFEFDYGQKFLENVCANYSLHRDPGFDSRRKFYELSRSIRNLDGALSRNFKNNLPKLYREFQEFVATTPVL